MLIDISDRSQTGEARRVATALAEELQMEEGKRGNVALAATEMASNLLKHAGRGHILVQRLEKEGHTGLRITSVDKGPGIADITKALAGGYSTAGSMGIGLGAIRRVSNSFEVYSAPDSGTVISAEFWAGKNGHPIPQGGLEIGAVSEPIAGEEVCGDGWAVKNTMDDVLLMVVDGLGHGVLAAEAAQEAEKMLASTKEKSPTNIIVDAHAALKKTRGAAEAVARIELSKGLVSFAGVGNISASIVAPGISRSLASHNGTLGQQLGHVQEFTAPWNRDSLLVMHSDGLTSRWDLNQYPGIWTKHPSVIAAVLHRDFSRGRDDVTVLVAKAA